LDLYRKKRTKMSKTFLSGQIDEKAPFPDGQPHITVASPLPGIVTCRIASPTDLFRLAMLSDLVKPAEMGFILRILYLMGGRMDRALSTSEPFTLKVVCDIINNMNWPKVEVFCPHSDVTMDLLKNSVRMEFEEDIFYDMSILNCLLKLPQYRDAWEAGSGKPYLRKLDDYSIVFPDKGCSNRMEHMEVMQWYPNASRVVLDKNRIERTGRIEGMKIVSGEVKKVCIIVDDLCDGGATFMFAAKCLRAAGAEHVFLAVCHGVLSKGLPIEGIDFVCTTNSFTERESDDKIWVQKFV
jgi:ribose-phosphate pyrophosphokinase